MLIHPDILRDEGAPPLEPVEDRLGCSHRDQVSTWALFRNPSDRGSLLSGCSLASAALGTVNTYTAPDSALTVLTGDYFLAWAVSIMVLDCTTSGFIIVGLVKTRSGTHHGDRLLKKVIRWVPTGRAGQIA